MAQARNNAIEAQLKKDRQTERRSVKILLLGSGESGKSTIVKQMKLIHRGPYTLEERLSFVEVIYSNTVQSMKVLVEAMDVLGIPCQTPQAQDAARLIEEVPSQVETSQLPVEWAHALATLWHDAGVQRAFARSREFQLNDSAPYYFDSIDRLGAPNYVPTDQDVLRTRVKTTGIIEETFEMDDGVVYRMFDVGGQRSERRKWIHCFEGVTGLLFLAALSEYDQALYEDARVNRMQEALTLFDSICNSRWFAHSSLLLFMNKSDLFRAKLPRSPLQDYFVEYKPPMQATEEESFQHAADFLTKKFCALSRDPSRVVYPYLTCATDTHQIKFVLQAVRDIITRSNLREVGLL